MLRRVALVSTDVSEELGASFIRVTTRHNTQKTPIFIVTAVKTLNIIYETRRHIAGIEVLKEMIMRT
jgi:hypothetical protein